MRGVFIGRFQPFHKGHLEVIRLVLQEVDELIVVIGSSQRSHELINPFTTGERLLMIRSVLREAELPEDRIWLIPVPDLNLNPLWVRHVQSYCPEFSCVYSNNSLVKILFEEQGIPVSEIKMVKRKQYSSTRIRELIIAGKAWTQLVPKAVAQIIRSINGVKRLRILSKGDKVT
ncbi:MAG: nicotinamide-nucleotide adenylyltransferase [Candidatus Ranarchaeia archaeon]